MIHFFKTIRNSIIAVKAETEFGKEDLAKLCWLFGESIYTGTEDIKGVFIGPRREMVTPWSTNAVEIIQNMNINGILRIEEYFRCKDGENTQFDEMLQRRYDKLDQRLFDINILPASIKYIEDLEAYNESEGLALSKDEIEYLHSIEEQNNRKLTDSEVFGFAQINSEHCRHKIFGGRFIIDGEEKEDSLFAMIKRTTAKHKGKILSAYKDNVAFASGPKIEQFSPTDATTSSYFTIKEIDSVISLKAETHNFPTTVEPFNGASTGTGGEIRDRMAGGTGSWPIAGTAVYMTSATSDNVDEKAKTRKWLYQSPEDILIKASNGASDFGNKFGQPLITGSVLTFEHKENGVQYGYDKVIMLAGGIGYGNKRDCIKGEPQKGNKVVVVGGDNYRIGLGGGSVSSVDTGKYSGGIELNAIQRANPEMQKRAYNLVRALVEGENNPVVSIHDHGSAGHLNCLSELVEDCGGKIEIDKLPIGDETLSAKEIIANESQERMGLLINEEYIEQVKKIAERERAPLYVVGETTGDEHFSFVGENGEKPFDLDVKQMFGHSPITIMRDNSCQQIYKNYEYAPIEHTQDNKVQNEERLLKYIEKVLRLEAVACKDWLTNKVDRSVTGKVARQQCQGELQLPLSDCGVVALDYRGTLGIATAIGHAPQASLADARKGAILAVAESLTNLIFAPLTDGLSGVSLSANWMWPCRSAEGEDARLYNAVEALSDFCISIGANVPTGKDSLSMTQQYPDGSKVIAPGTVIISSAGEVSDIRKVVSPVLINDKNSSLYHIDFSFDEQKLGGSAFAQSNGKVGNDIPCISSAEYFIDCFNAVQELIHRGWVIAGHDISAGGLITTLLEMTFANTKGGIHLNMHDLQGSDIIKNLFSENPGVVLQVRDIHKNDVRSYLEEEGVGFSKIGYPTPEVRAIVVKKGEAEYTFDIDYLRNVWYEKSYKMDLMQSHNGTAKERKKNVFRQPLEIKLPNNFTGKLSKYGISPDRRKESGVHAAIIREKGTNGEREMAYALYLAGFDVKDVTMTDLISGCETLEDISLIVFCGGFSNSDVLGSAKGWAGAFLYNHKAKQALDKFYSRPDTMSLGVCNGCQLMIELGLINPEHTEKTRMLHNISGKFESSFVSLNIPKNNSIMLSSLQGSKLGIWVAHGEGRFSLPYPEDRYNIVAKYDYAQYPANPNGSDYNVAGLCSKDGRHLAMMPHLERTIFPWQNAYYPTHRQSDEVTPWIEAFTNAYSWLAKQ